MESRTSQNAFFELPTCVAIAPPAVRSVVVEAGASIEGTDSVARTWHRIHPIVAIRTAIIHHYIKRIPVDGDPYPKCAPIPELLVKEGWRFRECETVESPMVISGCDYGLYGVQSAEEALSASNVVWGAFVAPWPEVEDAERLASQIAELRRQAEQQVASRANRPASSPA